MTLGYLNTQYPSLSHTFIEREIAAVRREGIEVRTYSIRRPDAHGVLGAEHAAAARETSYVVTGRLGTLGRGLVAALQNIPGAFRALLASQRLSPAGLGPRLKHAVYALEALILARMLRRDGVRHVHVHMANNGAAVAMLACDADPRLTYSLSIHGSAEFFDLERLKVGAKAARAVFVRCISNFCRAQVMVAAPQRCWQNLHVVHCGIDVTRFRPSTPSPARGPATDEPDPAPTSPLRILAVGRLHQIKAYPLLIRAVARLNQQGVPAHLDLVGDGPQRRELERLTDALGARAWVTFSGAVSQDDIARHYDEADVFVVSSLMEGVPVVLMEAMACSKPVVATRVGGIPELVEHEVAGLLVDPASPAALADALAILADSPDLRASMGRAGRSRVERAFDINESGRQMASLFRRLVLPPSDASRADGPAPPAAPGVAPGPPSAAAPVHPAQESPAPVG